MEKDSATKNGVAKSSTTQVLKHGKRRIVGGTKFGQDGCGY